jgi:hypothetical protein
LPPAKAAHPKRIHVREREIGSRTFTTNQGDTQMKNRTTTFRRVVAVIAAASMLTVLVPQTGRAAWDDRSGQLPGISSAKSAIILGAAIGGGLVAFGYLKKRGEYPLDVVDKLEFVADSVSEAVVLTNNGKETLTLSELRFDTAGFETAVSVPTRIEPGQEFEIMVHRNMERTGKDKKAKLFLTALRAGGKSVNRTVSIRAAS